jgi:hypothetical protein
MKENKMGKKVEEKKESEITEITVNYGETWGMPNYSSIRMDIATKVLVGPYDDVDEVRRTLIDATKEVVIDELGIAEKDFMKRMRG